MDSVSPRCAGVQIGYHGKLSGEADDATNYRKLHYKMKT